MYALCIGVAGVLLALQIEPIAPADEVCDFGLIAGVSAISATALNPVAGALPDRSGQRDPRIPGGGLAAVPAMFPLGLADTILPIGSVAAAPDTPSTAATSTASRPRWRAGSNRSSHGRPLPVTFGSTDG